MRVVLHIGIHKTGSTAIQTALSLNTELLATQGVLYPQTGRWPADGHTLVTGHHRLPWSFTRPEGDDPWSSLKRELAETDKDIIILSSEEFEMVRRADQLDQIAKHLAGHDVTVVAYLRRQDEYLHGMYCTQVLHYEAQWPFEAYKAYWGSDLDYEQLLTRWEAAFGRAALLVRPYESAQLVNGDVVDDFFTQADLIPTDLIRADRRDRVNRSYPRNAVEMCASLRAQGADAETFGHAREILAWMYEGRKTDSDVMSPAERAAVLREFQASNQRVAQTYLGRDDGTLFTDANVGDAATWRERYESKDAWIHTSLSDLHSRITEIP